MDKDAKVVVFDEEDVLHIDGERWWITKGWNPGIVFDLKEIKDPRQKPGVSGKVCPTTAGED